MQAFPTFHQIVKIRFEKFQVLPGFINRKNHSYNPISVNTPITLTATEMYRSQFIQ